MTVVSGYHKTQKYGAGVTTNQKISFVFRLGRALFFEDQSECTENGALKLFLRVLTNQNERFQNGRRVTQLKVAKAGEAADPLELLQLQIQL